MSIFSKLTEKKRKKREHKEFTELLYQAMKDYNPGRQIHYKPQITKKSDGKESEHLTPEQPQQTKQQEQAKWCFSIEHIGETAKAQYKIAISNSYVEQLDWAIYYGFQLYVAICEKRRNPGFATAFLDWYKYFLLTDWRMPSDYDENTIQKLIDTRISIYDDIMCSTPSASEKNARLQDAIVQFICKDRLDDPFAPEIAILPIDEIFKLNICLTTLYSKTIETTKNEWDYISNTNFYIQFEKDTD